jgi:hypothetical protein
MNVLCSRLENEPEKFSAKFSTKMEGNMASSGEGAHLIGGEELKVSGTLSGFFFSLFFFLSFQICSTDDSVEEADIPQLVANLIKHYSESGAPSHRAEEKAHRLFSVLNLNATCVCLPTGHTFTFDQNRVIYVSLEDPSLSLVWSFSVVCSFLTCFFSAEWKLLRL